MGLRDLRAEPWLVAECMVVVPRKAAGGTRPTWVDEMVKMIDDSAKMKEQAKKREQRSGSLVGVRQQRRRTRRRRESDA
ncbi:MAG: hypothetical protein GY953_52975 [bacterium]|nr:hypothetical protein [bacterium]